MGVGHSSLMQNLQKHETGRKHDCSGTQVLSLKIVCRGVKVRGGFVERNKSKEMTGLEQLWER